MDRRRLTYTELMRQMQEKADAEEARQKAARGSRKAQDDEEHRVQSACVKWFYDETPWGKMYAGLLFAIPNGGKRPTKSYTKKNGIVVTYCPEGAKLKEEGALKGVADLMLAVPKEPYHGLFIEMKKEKGGRQSDEQKLFEERVSKVGYKYALCKGEREFKDAIIEYLHGKL